MKKLNYIFLLSLTITAYYNAQISAASAIQLGINKQINCNLNLALILAAQSGNEDVLKNVLQSSGLLLSNINLALMIAARYAHENIIKILLEVPGININAQDAYGRTALMEAARHNDHENIVKLLLTVPGINLNLVDRRGNTALMWAVIDGTEDMLQLLLQDSTLNINMQDHDGNSALINAAIIGYAEMVRMLLSTPHISINARDREGKTALIRALENQNLISAQLIKTKLNDLSDQAFEAINNNDLRTLESIARQIGVDIFDRHANTLLHAACDKKAPEIVLFLLQNADDPRELLAQKNNAGLIPFDLMNPHSDLFEYFMYLAYGQEPTQQINAETQEKEIESTKRKRDLSSPEVSERLCGHCKKLRCVNRCSGCRSIYYCSPECQKANWKVHKTQCASPAS